MTTVTTTAEDSCVDELAVATRALLRAIDKIENDTTPQTGLELLAQALCGCMRQAGLLAALAGALRTMAGNEQHAALLVGTGPLALAMGEITLDLDSMRSLLRRATLVAAPALADLRRATTACHDLTT